MAAAHCASCDAPITGGTHCAICAGNASTLIANASVAGVAAPDSRAERKKGDPLIGVEVIGQYVIRAQLGKGGMGAVYLADQPSVGRRAVIKVLHPNLSRDADTRSRFETEARAASQLNHPNIVTIYNYGAMDDGTLFLAMEYLDGQTLAQATSKRRLALTRVVNIVSQIADALGEAHRRGVVHRDVKPTNVMLVERGEQEDFVKVLDFGIAHIDGARVTATGEICGTPTYMSPEQIRGKSVDGRSDLYSLGCMLFELVTGEVPFEAGNALGLAYKHTHEQPPRASQIAPRANIPASLDAFLVRALAKAPADRFRDAAAFRDELRAAMAPARVPMRALRKDAPESAGSAKSRAVLAKTDSKRAPKSPRTPGLVRRLVEGAAAALPIRRRPKSLAERIVTRVRMFGPRPRRQRARWAWIVAAAVIALSMVGIGWYVMTRPASDERVLAHPPNPATPSDAATKRGRTKPRTGEPSRR